MKRKEKKCRMKCGRSMLTNEVLFIDSNLLKKFKKCLKGSTDIHVTRGECNFYFVWKCVNRWTWWNSVTATVIMTTLKEWYRVIAMLFISCLFPIYSHGSFKKSSELCVFSNLSYNSSHMSKCIFLLVAVLIPSLHTGPKVFPSLHHYNGRQIKWVYHT